MGQRYILTHTLYTGRYWLTMIAFAFVSSLVTVILLTVNKLCANC